MISKSVYCSGSIVKGGESTRKLVWSATERAELAGGARPEEVVFLNPDDPISDGAQDLLAQFGRDMFQIHLADAVVVDGRERRGIGIGVEIAAATAMGTPVIFVAPAESEYRRSRLEFRGAVVMDYVHPHVHSLASTIVDSFAEAGKVLNSLERRRPPRPIPPWIRPAIDQYREVLLPDDEPMRRALFVLNRADGVL